MGEPQIGGFIRENPTKMNDLGYPYFRKPPFALSYHPFVDGISTKHLPFGGTPHLWKPPYHGIYRNTMTYVEVPN